MEKLLTVTDKSAWGLGVSVGQFLGEAESNTQFEQMFEALRGNRALLGLCPRQNIRSRLAHITTHREAITLKVEIDPTIFLTYRAKDIQTKFTEEPTCIEVDEVSNLAMEALDRHSFDQAPVTENGVIVGWILRSDMNSKKSISETYRVLSQGDLISADAPLNDLLQKLVSQHLVFIVGASGIEGFAVQSDIERNVSRAHLYLLISGLEILIAKILSKDLVKPTDVVPFMSRNSKKHWELAKADHDDANPIEYLDLSGLGKAFLIEKGALNHLGISERDWKRYIFKLKRIRDWVAHSNTQEMRREPFPDVVKRMKRTEEYVRKLVEY